MTENQLPSWRGRTGTATPVATPPPPARSSAAEPVPAPRPAPAPSPEPQAQERGPIVPSNILFAILGAAVAAGVIGLALATSGGDEPEASATTESSVVDQLAFTDGGSDSTTPQSDAAMSESAERAADSEAAEGEIAAPSPGAEEGLTTATPLSPTEDRRAVFSGGIVYLRGSVPSREVADAIVTKAGAVVGPDNVVDEYVIDPSVSFDPAQGAPLYVQDLVLFPTGSTEIGPQFVPLLDLGIVLMTQNPQVTVDVIGHTDSVGSSSRNMSLSQERVNAVLRYWIAAGIDPARLRGVGKGEAEPLADNATDEGKRINRRVEFVIAGLLS